MSGWVNAKRAQKGAAVLMAVGSSRQDGRALMLDDGGLSLWAGGQGLASGIAIEPGVWTAVAATYDGGTARLFVNGRQVAANDVEVAVRRPCSASRRSSSTFPNTLHFGGQLAELKLHNEALTARNKFRRGREAKPDFGVIVFYEVGGHWPWQVKQWRGLQEPQDPWTLPERQSAVQQTGRQAPGARGRACACRRRTSGRVGRWRLAEAPKVQERWRRDFQRLTTPMLPGMRPPCQERC